jgi:hypothetical protein
MFARIHAVEGTAEQQAEGLRVLRDEILPWLRDSTGYRGVIRLADGEAGRAITITLWATEDDLRESGEAAERLGTLISEGIGTTRHPLAEYEVTLVELEQ